MYSQILFLILSYYVIFGVVGAISIEGAPLTTYSPCGSRLLYFIKQSPTQWNATLNVRHKHIEADIKIRFVDDVSLTLNPEYGDKLSLSATVNQTFKIHAVAEPKQQIFTIKVDNDRVPTVSELTVNNVVICDNNIKKNQSPNDQASDICGTRSRFNEELYSVRTHAGNRDWPWYAGIYINGVFEWGGSIISATTVITTAYSTQNTSASLVTVVAGTNVLTDLQHPGRQERQAIKLIVYPDYVYNTYDTGDIALIKVNEFNFNMYVRPICVSGPHYDRNSIAGETGIIVGAGNLNNESNNLKRLMSTDTIIRSTTECKKIGHKAGKSIFCAGFGPTSNLNPNFGDSGGGLVIPTVLNGRVTWYLRGIFNGCIVVDGHCDVKQYVTYVDVAAYYEWIHWHIMFS